MTVQQRGARSTRLYRIRPWCPLMRIPCSGGIETGGFDSRVPLINIRASVYTHMPRLHAEGREACTRGYTMRADTSVNFSVITGYKPYDKRKARRPRTVIFRRIYGAPYVTTLLQDAAQRGNPRGWCYVPMWECISISLRFNVDYRETWVYCRAKRHTRNRLVVTATTSSDCSYKVDIVNVVSLRCMSRAVIFSRFCYTDFNVSLFDKHVNPSLNIYYQKLKLLYSQSKERLLLNILRFKYTIVYSLKWIL